MSKFKVRDRVRFTAWPFEGRTGTIVRIVREDPAFPYDVDVDGDENAVAYPTAEKELEHV